MAPWSWLTRRRRIDHDVQEEIRSHLAIAAGEREANGAEQKAARLGALKEFGNVTLATEAARRVWSTWWIETAADLLHDVRYAVRVLRRSPGFSLIVIVVLALGIGLNAAVFTLFKSLALKPLAGVDGSAGLGVVLAKTSGGQTRALSYPDYQYIRDHDRAFAGLAGSWSSMVSLGVGNRGERTFGEFVTGNYFQVLGVRARLGRTLLPSDEIAPGKHPVVVLSDSLWRRVFGGDPNVVGTTVHVNAHALTVVGVAAPDFHGSVVIFDVGLFVPVMMMPQLGVGPQSDLLSDRNAAALMVLGRLQPGVALATAASEMSVLSAQLAADTPLHANAGAALGAPADGIDQRALVLPIWRSPYGAQTYMLPAIVVLGAMGALLLLIVCANVAGLILVRGISRRGEIAVRLALGASRTRILRLLLIENLVLAVPGAAVGLLLAWRVLPVIWSAVVGIASGFVYLDLSVDRLVIAFAVLASCASALFFGLVPAVRSSRMDLASAMKDDLSPRGAARGRFRAALVVSQVAVSLLLLVGAGLVARSLDAARHADAGFDAGHVISVLVDLKANGYDESRGRAFYEELLDGVRADEGVDSASLAMRYPMAVVAPPGQAVVVDGHQSRRDEDLMFLSNVVSPDYFRTLRIGLVSGREFARRDDASGPQVVIVNDTLARRFWGSASNAIGKRLRVASGEWRSVVGVARDVKYSRINENPRPYVYLPLLQSYQPNMMLHTRGAVGSLGAPTIVTLLDQARRHIQALDPNLPIFGARPLSEYTDLALGVYDMTARTLLLFGGVALGLAALGIYGLVSYTVKQRTHEIGIRMALGAQRTDIIRRFLGRGLRLGAIGAAVGMAISFATTRFIATVLYGVSATDAVSFLAASVVVVGSVLVATLIPAWRAARTSPIAALRHQ